MKWLIVIAALLAAAPLRAEPEIRSEVSYESAVRDSGRFDTNRFMGEISGKWAGEKVPVEVRGDLRAFFNASSHEYGLTDTRASIQTLSASYWGDKWGITGGMQQVSWSETFGYQSVDIVNSRDFRDFGPLDHGRNRLAAPNLNGFFTAGPFKIAGYLTPQGQLPRLPTGYKGASIRNDEPSGQFFTYPEGGIRVSTTLADANASVFAYRHLSRLPVLLPIGPAALTAFYRPVISYGATFSRGFNEVVFRADGIVTQDQPVALPTLTGTTTQVTYSGAAGVDWSPSAIYDFTVGMQANVDRFAILNADPRFGASVMVRKGFFNGKLELEGKAFSRFRSGDYWFQLNGKVRAGDNWEFKAGGEWLGDDPTTPTSLLGYTSRAIAQVIFVF